MSGCLRTKAIAVLPWFGLAWNGFAILRRKDKFKQFSFHAPDRLSRKYAYQVLLTEEFARAGVEVLFVKAPRNATAEDQLLLQFQA